ncbi:hypothetical protein DXG03_005321 [Asterophora parasitica]|uniref:RBR-type E3 ubiquitin transferase n=1 Tax=Asterophora parasitica TaxID=117018 RepID=A0A9P7GA53_9AGAR|nr:hypothetical protein DXG03_005321 [Asterophora parasitica]
MSSMSSGPSQTTSAPPKSTQATAKRTTGEATGTKHCRAFQLGKCPHGERCKFIHKKIQQTAEETQPKNLNTPRGGNGKEKEKEKEKEPRKESRDGPSGLRARESHPQPNTPQLSSGPSRNTSRAPSSRKPCIAWQRDGKCFRGDKCSYSHGSVPGNVSRSKKGPSQLSNIETTSIAVAQTPGHAAQEHRDAQERLQAFQRTRTTQQEAARVLEAKQSEERRAQEHRDAQERLQAFQRARNAQQEATRVLEAKQLEERRAEEEAAQQRARLEEAARVREANRLKAEREAARRREVQANEEAARQILLAQREARRIEQEAAFTSQHIVLGSTLITCGSGLEIRDPGIVSGFESCRLTIRSLPSDVKPGEIAELFTQQGMSRDAIHILSINPAIENHREAKVLTSAEQGGAIAVGLDGIEFRNNRLRFEVGENTSNNAMGESSAREADTLTVTWSAPSSSMIAKYSTMDEARVKARDLDRVVIAGRRIKAVMNPPPTGPALRFYDPASVKITGLPVDVSVDTVMERAGTVSVRVIKSNVYDLQKLLEDLRQHFTALPDNGMTSFAPDLNRQIDGVVTVKARFETWDQADNARSSFKDQRFRPDCPHFRFSLPQPLVFIITMPLQQFEAQKTQWDSLANAKHGKSAHVHLHRAHGRGLVQVRLSGDDKKAVGALKVRVETLAAGAKLDAAHWHRTFLSPKGRKFLESVFSETKAYVRADFRIQALKIYGDGNTKDAALQMIEDEVGRLAHLEWTVLLKRQSVGYFVRKGLAALKEVLGEDAVTLNLSSAPCKLTIRGGEEARHALSSLMDQSLKDLDMAVHPSGGDDICPICYDAVSHPVELGCKHVYCMACMRHYLTSAAETKIFPLLCMGEEANCKVPIPIPVIQRFLIPQQFEHLVNVVFSTYLERHPQDFKYCITPDCTQIYRANTRTMLKCPSCFAEVCSSCHEEAHEGMTCEERRERKAQEENQLNDNWAEMHGVKRCPSCQVYIEKTEGCNHMSCRCGAHICWICMQVFPAGQIYEHLGLVHGGAFDGDRERQNNDLQHALALQRQLDDRRDANLIPAHQHIRRVDPRPPAHPVHNAPPRAVPAAYERLLDVARRQQALDDIAQEEHRRRLAEREAQAIQEAEARRQQRLEDARRQQALNDIAREEYQRRFAEREAQAIREAEARRRQEGGWGCTVM